VDDERIDELRQRLRTLGYLDAGVDRFVLAPARGARGPVAVAARASVRVGLLGGLLLGPAAALGVGARLPGLVSGARDAVVLAIYLAVLFVGAIAAATFAVSLLARRASRLVGWLTTAACLAYLTLWWRNANAGFGWSAPVWTGFALVVAVAISLLLGHAVRIATLGVLAARRPSNALPPVPSTSWRVIVGGGASAFAGAAALLVLTTSASGAPALAPPLTVVSQGAVVKVLAIDGVDPTLVDEREWVAGWGYGGRRYVVDYGDTGDPARMWTTIATGEPPDVHGIHAIEGRRVAGLRGMLSPESSETGRVLQQATDLIRLTQPSVASRTERKVMTFWEVAESAGLRTAVFNWWATWPAVTRTGIVVSDRAVLRLEHGGTLDAEISPPQKYAVLEHKWPQMTKDAQALAERSFSSVATRDTAEILVRSATLDAMVLEMDAALAEKNRDLDVVYLPGLDIAQHALLGDRGDADASPSALSARIAALRDYHHFLGELIHPWLRPVDKQVVVIIAAPGRIGSATGHVTIGTWIEPHAGSPFIDWATGHPQFEDVKEPIRALDVAPTVLSLLGIPISRELPGTVLHASLLTSAERFVSTYGRPAQPERTRDGRPLDQETIDRLRSLGYIK
jgi:Type I phosphodiesterase / nucleotide pyrophosphatase